MLYLRLRNFLIVFVSLKTFLRKMFLFLRSELLITAASISVLTQTLVYCTCITRINSEDVMDVGDKRESGMNEIAYSENREVCDTGSNQEQTFFKETTELGYGVVITPGGPGFICRPRDRLFLFSSVSPNKCRDITLNYTMATSFYILRISLIIILSFDAIQSESLTVQSQKKRDIFTCIFMCMQVTGCNDSQCTIRLMWEINKIKENRSWLNSDNTYHHLLQSFVFTSTEKLSFI